MIKQPTQNHTSACLSVIAGIVVVIGFIVLTSWIVDQLNTGWDNYIESSKCLTESVRAGRNRGDLGASDANCFYKGE